MEETGNLPIDGEIKGGANEGLPLFDFSASDDFLLLSSSEAVFLDEAKMTMKGANSFQPSELSEPDMSGKKEKYNLRKSLAWDSAFFTSEGVLEPEEISSIMEGVDNGGSKRKQMLPGIQEDLIKSTESISSFESDALTLESLEADLFCDIRASIQRSNKASTPESSIKFKGSERIESPGALGAQKLDPHHGNFMKSSSAPKKPPTSSIQGVGRSIKGVSANEKVKPLVRSRETSNSILRPPAIRGSLSSVSQPQKTSLGSSRIRSDTIKSGSVKVAARVGRVSKDTCSGDSRSMMSKTTSSPKSSSGSLTVTVTGLSRARSSFDSTSSHSSVNPRISSLPSQRKTDRTVKLPSSISKQKTQSKSVLKSKVQPGTARLSVYLKSTSKQSSNISPASSISEWSSVSSSSTTTQNQKGSSSKYHSGSHKGVMDEKATQDPLALPIEPTSSQLESEAGSIQHQSAQKTSAGSRPSNPISGKPSGLRLPSPKIGFFDGGKTGGRTPVGSLQTRSGMPSSRLHKSGAGESSPSEVTGKGKVGSPIVKTTTKVAGKSRPDAMKSPSSAISKSAKLQNNSALTQTLPPKIKGERSESKVLRLYGSSAGKNNSLVDPKSNQKVHCDTTLTEKIIAVQEVAGGITIAEEQNIGPKENLGLLDKQLEALQKMGIAEEIQEIIKPE